MRRVRHAPVFALILLSMAVTPAFGQSAYQWKGWGGVTALAVDPLTTTTLFAATDSGVFKSTDGGASWTETNLQGHVVFALAIDPLIPTMVYAGTGSGVFKSTDGGVIWDRTASPEDPVHHLAIDPSVPTTLYAISERIIGSPFGSLNERYLLKSSTVLKSTDAGTTWGEELGLEDYYFEDAPEDCDPEWGCYSDFYTVRLSALAVDPFLPGARYVALRSVREQRADISIWSEVRTPTGSTDLLIDSSVSALAIAQRVDPRGPATVYAAQYYAVLKSVDSGRTWRSTGLQNPRALAIDPMTPSTVYAGGRDLLKTTDGAVTWNAAGTGLTDALLAYDISPGINVLAIDPVISATLYAGTTIGVFKSRDGGVSWSRTGLAQRSLLRAVGFRPADALAGRVVTGTVTLAAPAPAGGVTATLRSSGDDAAAVSVPNSVTVPAGSTSAQFSVSTRPQYFGYTTPAIEATLADATRSATLRISPASITTIVSAANEQGRMVESGVWAAARRITFTFTGTADVNVDRFECRFWRSRSRYAPDFYQSGSEPYVPCSSPVTYSGLEPFNVYTFVVRAVDTSSNVEPARTYFNLAALPSVGPSITNVTPGTVFTGESITVVGEDLIRDGRAPAVTIAGVMAGASILGGDRLRITVPATAATGRVTVTTVDGSATSATELVVVRRPAVTSFTPAAGPPGTVVMLSGTNLASASGLRFGGVDAVMTLLSATLLRAIVPPGTATGTISLLTRAGSVSSARPFTVTAPGDLLVHAVTSPPSAAISRPLSVTTAVRNAGGSAVPASTLRLYLSTDEALAPSNRLLATRTIGNLGAGAMVTLTATTTVPADLAPGTYRILATIEVAGGAPEGDATNNLGISGPVSVALYRPNLAMTALTPPTRGAVGQLIAVQNTVRNTGPAPAGAFAILFHLSGDAALDEGDPVIGTRTLGRLPAGGTSAVSTSLRLPVGIEPGPYYVIAVADALGQQVEVDETNQVMVAGPVAILPYQAELALTALTVPARWGIGQTLGVANTVRNTGLAPATAFTVRFYLSPDGVLDAEDPLVGSRPLGGLGAGAVSAVQTALRLPVTAREGEYYLIAVVDGAGQQGEWDETNNVTVSAPFTVVPYQLVDRGEPGECGGVRTLGWLRPAACAPPPDPPMDGPGDGDD